jgi:hypothetical protein
MILTVSTISIILDPRGEISLPTALIVNPIVSFAMTLVSENWPEE